MRLTTLAMVFAGLGCSDDGGGASSTPCEAHADCDLAGQEICDLEQGVCATHGLCAPRSEEAFASLHCPYPDLVCEGGACVPAASTGGEGEGEAGAGADTGGVGEGEAGAGDVGGEAGGAWALTHTYTHMRTHMRGGWLRFNVVALKNTAPTTKPANAYPRTKTFCLLKQNCF